MNNTPNDISSMEARFHKLVGFLRNFGFNGEVALKAGLLIIGAHDKASAAMIRKAFRAAPSASSGTLAEVRSRTGGAAFVWVGDDLAMGKQEIRTIALAA